MRRISFALLVALLLLLPCKFAFAKDTLAGTWTVTVTPDDTGNAYDDTLTFKASKFTSKACQNHGFDAMDYRDDTRGMGAATFTAEATSDKAGKISWQGTATGDSIEGTYTWTKKDGSTTSYHFSGKKK